MSRVWIYQADRPLQEAEETQISAALDSFVQSWTAHGNALAGQAYIKHKLFLIFEVDEQQAGVTGCSIDKSVHFVKTLGQQYDIDFFNRLNVVYIDQQGQLQLVSRDQFVALIQAGSVTVDTTVFNNMIDASHQLATQWQVPLRDSWHSKVF